MILFMLFICFKFYLLIKEDSFLMLVILVFIIDFISFFRIFELKYLMI